MDNSKTLYLHGQLENLVSPSDLDLISAQSLSWKCETKLCPDKCTRHVLFKVKSKILNEKQILQLIT